MCIRDSPMTSRSTNRQSSTSKTVAWVSSASPDSLASSPPDLVHGRPKVHKHRRLRSVTRQRHGRRLPQNQDGLHLGPH
eukprot:509179-Heterocapsa_arctica.AAC.1